MESTKFGIAEFLIENDKLYENANGVTINFINGQQITLDCLFPGTTNSTGMCCYLHAEFYTDYCFSHFFPCESDFDLDTLNQQYLSEQFNEGAVEVRCYYPENKQHAVAFKLRNGQLYMVDQLYRQRQEVNTKLKSGEDFINYARQYFANKTWDTSSGSFSLFKFLSKQEYEYMAINELLELKLLPDRSIMITGPYHGYDSGAEEILCTFDGHFETEQDFYDFFPVKQASDLHNITDEYLAQKYEEGQISVCCLLELGKLGGHLYFKKSNGMLFAEDDYYAKKLPVPQDLSSAPDFIEFTLRYCISRSQWKNHDY
ncbi:MAG: hypothetical protein BGO55_08535 [Sphingobacteriales bacterium 50-39]|nr:hypothetical protein [Sphingobacteriales bacterium]OJW59310.1 MAG: hypothetical protein BGO55_08535 [Sphingobacteriales bacterium 50-39]